MSNAYDKEFDREQGREAQGGEDARNLDQEIYRDVPKGAVEIPVEIVEDEPSPEEAEASSGEGTDGEAAAETAPIDPAERVAELEAALEEQKKLFEAEMRDLRMRSQAELENFKKRLSREHDEHLKYAAEKVMKDIIPSLDNLELAITYGSRDEACKNMLQGVEMTEKLLLDAVGRHGLERVGKVGEVFDPSLHEAIGTDSRPDMEPDTVTRVMQSGYNLQGRLLRPAKVMVNRP